jgi:hypothetical protein
MLIDEFLSDYDFVETHAVSIRASAAEIYQTAGEVDFADSFIVRSLFRVRGLATKGVTLQSLTSSRFEILGEIPGKEMLLGVVGKFWKLDGELKKIDAVSFTNFDTPGYAKAVWNFSLAEEGDATRLATETRIKCLDPESRKRFGFYWTLIQPFSGLIRMEMLRAIKRRAETV